MYLLFAGLIVFFQVLSLFIYYIDKNQQREQWREAVEFVEKNPDKNAIVLFEFSAPPAPYQWYSKKIVEAQGATDAVSADGQKTKAKTLELVKEKNSIYLFDYLRDLSDPQRVVEASLKEAGYDENPAYYNFVGVGKIVKWLKN